MPNMIRKLNVIRTIEQARFGSASMNILWVESFVFAGIYGLMFRSWFVSVGIFLCLSAVMMKRETSGYAVIILSFLWSFVFAAIGYGVAGIAGAMILGGMVFVNGVRLHFRDLRFTHGRLSFSGNIDTVDWRRGWYGRLQNLN